MNNCRNNCINNCTNREEIKPILYNGENYYTVSQFAELVNRSRAYIYVLFNQGGPIRRLKGIRIGGKPFISAKEVTEYPFKSQSKRRRTNGSRSYRYIEDYAGYFTDYQCSLTEICDCGRIQSEE